MSNIVSCHWVGSIDAVWWQFLLKDNLNTVEHQLFLYGNVGVFIFIDLIRNIELTFAYDK